MAKLTKFYAMPGKVMQDSFPHWMFFSRSAQILLSVIVLAVDAFILNHTSKMNRSDTNYNAYVGLFVKESHFAEFMMFTVVLSLLIFAYVLLAPKRAPQFYHVYGELALEVLLVIFWLASFAGTADFISKADQYNSVLDGYLEDWEDDDLISKSLIKEEKAARDSQKATAGLGALIFALSLANSVFLGVYCFRKFRSSKAGTENQAAPTDNEVEKGTSAPEVTPQPAPSNTETETMPPGFSGHEETPKTGGA